MNKEVTIFSDGGSRGNPGPSGIGAVLYNKKQEKIFEISEYLGIATNNQAEYQALIRALEKASELKFDIVKVFLDSELIVKQLNGEYKIKNKGLTPLFLKVYDLSKKFKNIKFSHIYREKNIEADKLVNQAIDSVG